MDKFRLYKEGELLDEGSSPIKITNCTPGTKIAKGVYQVSRVVDEEESNKIDVPEFETLPALTITVAGKEQTGAFISEDISQVDYLALNPKDANKIYKVQPANNLASARIYFLGDQIIDLVKESDGNVLYSRNYLRNSSVRTVRANNNSTIPAGIETKSSIEGDFVHAARLQEELAERELSNYSAIQAKEVTSDISENMYISLFTRTGADAETKITFGYNASVGNGTLEGHYKKYDVSNEWTTICMPIVNLPATFTTLNWLPGITNFSADTPFEKWYQDFKNWKIEQNYEGILEKQAPYTIAPEDLTNTKIDFQEEE